MDSTREGGSNTTWYYVIGPKGAVQFMLIAVPGMDLMPADLGYHALEPMYEGHEGGDECAVLDNRPCYYDGSGLHARKVMEAFHESGDDPESIWKYLEDYYEAMFGV